VYCLLLPLLLVNCSYRRSHLDSHAAAAAVACSSVSDPTSRLLLLLLLRLLPINAAAAAAPAAACWAIAAGPALSITALHTCSTLWHLVVAVLQHIIIKHCLITAKRASCSTASSCSNL
jgi:hypothetical protein